jgi:tRNA A-37 threonylcarbamoyl transferase component Bud32
MPKMKTHPSREQLNAYNLGQLPPDEAITIENHISECEPCCDTIISLSSDDTFVGLLKDARQLVVEQNLDHRGAKPPSPHGEFPPELAEHPRYEIVRLIGKGGMGDVYEAIHRKMERKVALKVINRELFQKAEVVNRFHREVKTAAQLSHPNIVTSYDADQAGDFHFMVMEYVDGVDLSQTVKDQGALPIADACNYIRQAATGLQHAHERGMVHRDIKPHNLMVTADGTIKILDFGLASLAPETISSPEAFAPRSDLTVVGAIMGTPDFISPEQAKDARQVDIRSDIYSLGATLYYLLSGRVPFDDGSVMRKLKSHAHIDPSPLNMVRADVPKELVAITSRMMAKDPDERYFTPREVADALESFLRTWRPDGATSQGQVTSGSGNMSGSGGKRSRVGDAGWDWRLALARVLLATACIPVSLIFYEAWNFDVESYAIGRVGDLVPAYLLPALCLSTISGALFVFHRSRADLRRSNGGDRRLLGMKPSEALSVAAVFVAGSLAIVLYYTQVNKWTYVEARGSVVAFSPEQLDEMPKVDLDPSERAVELWISGDDASLVQRGDRVQLQFEGWPAVESQGLFQGRVIAINPTADGAGKFRILVKASDNDSWPDDRYLRPGVRADGWVITVAQKPVDNRKRSRPSSN